MADEDIKKKLNIKIIYKYNEYTREGAVNKYNTLRDIRKILEKQLDLSVKQMKMMYKNNNILNTPESTKVYNYFGDVDKIEIEMVHRDGAEDDYIMVFEKAFIGMQPPEELKKKKSKIKHLKSIRSNKQFEPKFKERKICNYDTKNEAKYVCLKCGEYWCKHCLKFEVHQNDICLLEQIDFTLKKKRDTLIGDLDENISGEQHFPKLERIDFLLNEKVSVLDMQFDEIINTIKRIKESQMKLIIDYFYQKVSDKKFKSLFQDVQFYKKTMREINASYKTEDIELNIKNLKTMQEGYEIILKKFDEFKIKFDDFDRLFMYYQNFNQIFKAQVEAKISQNLNVAEALNHPEEIDRDFALKKDIEKHVSKFKDKGNNLIKVKYYNSLMLWNHVNQRLMRISDFTDKFEFKLNYQVFAGNIFLNHKNNLFIVTGGNFNMFYFYDQTQNEIFRLGSLKENHCRGSLVYVKYLNAIFCISGKYTKKVEMFKLKYMRIDKSSSKSSSKLPDYEVVKHKNVVDKSEYDSKSHRSGHSSKSKSKKSFTKSKTLHHESKRDKEDYERSSKHHKTEKTHKNSSDDEEEDKKSRSKSRHNTKYDKNDDAKSHKSSKSHRSHKSHRSKSKEKKEESRSHISKREEYEEASARVRDKYNDPNYNYLEDKRLYWESYGELNIARNYACYYIFNDYYLFAFMGFNQYKGHLDSIERINLKEGKKWEMIKYENPKELDLHRNSMAVCYSNEDEIYILGGCIREDPTDQILKYNFKQNTFFKTDLQIPGFIENQYYRFWEESQFIPLTSKGNTINSDDDFTFGILDARDKVHLFNIRTFKYNII